MNTISASDAAAWWTRLWQAAPIAIALLGADRRYRAANPAFCRLMETDEATLLAWPYERVGYAPDLDVELDALVRLGEGAPAASYRRRFHTATGREFAATVHCLPGPGDALLQVVMPGNTQLASPASDERAWRSLAELGAALSHDAQEPARTLSVHLSIIAEDPSADRARSSLTAATNAARSLRGQLRGLVDYARLGRPVVAPVPTSLNDLLARACGELDPGCVPAIVRLTDGSLPCDPRQASLALRHLLANVWAFRRADHQATARVGISCIDGTSVLSVADDGRGIPVGDQPRLFRLFATGGRGEGFGVGIGLALCRAVAEGHGGRAWLESAPGQGTTVSLAFSPMTGALG
jgi:signal transduction histidine kinase